MLVPRLRRFGRWGDPPAVTVAFWSVVSASPGRQDQKLSQPHPKPPGAGTEPEPDQASRPQLDLTSMTPETVEPAVDSAVEQAADTAETAATTAAAADAKPAAVSVSTGKLCAADLIRGFEAEQLKSDLPEIYVGDTVKVGVRIREGNKERVQPYEGVVIAKRHGGLNATITVRRIFQGIGVERVFMLHSPQVASVKVERRGKVRRAKLFYLRDRVGKATRVKQRFDR
jgi:large subunit ribosomal protein L19